MASGTAKVGVDQKDLVTHLCEGKCGIDRGHSLAFTDGATADENCLGGWRDARGDNADSNCPEGFVYLSACLGRRQLARGRYRRRRWRLVGQKPAVRSIEL